MGANIYKTTYKNIEAMAIESRLIKAVFLPENGAKMASLLCKDTGREFLVQADGENYKKLSFAGEYVAAECSGFDDMFPTIDEYEYSEFPWKGACMPDHGEVCGLPWEQEVIESGKCLHLWVYSVRFSYRLDKWIRFADDSELSIEYEVKNLSPFDLDFIWAGHVMINAEKDAKIILPYKDGTKASCVFCSESLFLKAGDKLVWPQTSSSKGQLTRLDLTQERERTYKYYFDEAVPEGKCKYKYLDEIELELSFDSGAVPYLGIWINEGSFKGYHNIAFEPCTGTYDNPFRAREHGQYSVLPANGEYAWWLGFRINSKEDSSAKNTIE